MRFLDLRAAIRSLTRSPGFLTAAVLSLSVAIGASAAAFSVVDAVRFQTLPFSRWRPAGSAERAPRIAGGAEVYGAAGDAGGESYSGTESEQD